MSFSSFQTSEINDLKSQLANLQRLHSDGAESRHILRERISELEKDRDMWKANHDNQRNLKAAIIDRLDCGDRARKVVALMDKIKELEPDAQRYRALKQKIEYFCDDGGMRRATLDWCVEVNSLSPETLDEAIDQIILKK